VARRLAFEPSTTDACVAELSGDSDGIGAINGHREHNQSEFIFLSVLLDLGTGGAVFSPYCSAIARAARSRLDAPDVLGRLLPADRLELVAPILIIDFCLPRHAVVSRHIHSLEFFLHSTKCIALLIDGLLQFTRSFAHSREASRGSALPWRCFRGSGDDALRPPLMRLNCTVG